MTISKELLDELLQGCERPEDFFGDAGLMKELKLKNFRLEAGRFKGGLEVLHRVPAKGRYKRA